MTATTGWQAATTVASSAATPITKRGAGQDDQHGGADVSVYRYDAAGRVRLARTAHVTTTWHYGAEGRTAAIEQTLGGVTLAVGLQYDANGRLAALTLPGSDTPLTYTWDERGRPQAVGAGEAVLGAFCLR